MPRLCHREGRTNDDVAKVGETLSECVEEWQGAALGCDKSDPRGFVDLLRLYLHEGWTQSKYNNRYQPRKHLPLLSTAIAHDSDHRARAQRQQAGPMLL